MRIVEIEIEQLFGTFDHRIPLNTGDRITLIHGPNGFGKTILLEMLYGLFNGRYGKLRQIPFRQLVVRFEEGRRVEVRKGAPAGQLGLLEEDAAGGTNDLGKRRSLPGPNYQLEVAFSNGDMAPDEGSEFHIPPVPRGGFPGSGISPVYIAREIPHLERIGRESWFDTFSGELLSREDIYGIYGDMPAEEPSWWREVCRSVRIELIREQRLMKVRRATPGVSREAPSRLESAIMAPAINEYSAELAGTLEKKLAESVALSQSLDRTFPARLMKRIRHNGPTERELSEKLAELERKRKKLRDAGLLDEQEEIPLLPTAELGEETRDVLAIYVEDAEKKLGVFEDLARKIELFQDIINSRFLYKRLHVSREDGFVFTIPSGEPLPLSALSSGEQQEMVLLYELLFRLAPDSLVLIDEPEISLHVAWQKKFLEDLAKITELASFDVLIATHSPQIIHKRWDLTVELQSPRAEAELEAAALP